MQAALQSDVEAPVSYITRTGRKPFSYEYDPPPGTPRRSASYRDHLVRIRNARGLTPAPVLDQQGFALQQHAWPAFLGLGLLGLGAASRRAHYGGGGAEMRLTIAKG
jgi:hypothetical protein